MFKRSTDNRSIVTPGGLYHTLVRYFFGRFFENDLLEGSGDIVTTVVRALSIVAVPGLTLAFFLQNQYPQRAPWGRVEDHYFFVMYSFVAMAGVAVFEWDMLFPDRLDFLVLSHLPLQRRHMLGAKAGALALFIALFLVAANVFGWALLSIVSQEPAGRQVWAHAAGVLSAGVFGAVSVLALGGLLLCLLPGRAFRMISPLLRMVVVTALGLLLIHYFRFGDHLDEVLRKPGSAAGFIPSFWFLGLYEHLLRGPAAQPFVNPMMQRAVLGTGAAFLLAMVTYPLAWVKVRRMTLEGGASVRGRSSARRTWSPRLAVGDAPSRAVMHFIGQTMARNTQYQVYLAMYGGVGLALAISCAVTFIHRDGRLQAGWSATGRLAVIPLLLFWVVAGLRMAFALPVNLPARWIFRLSGAPREACVAAGRLWATVGGSMVLIGLLFVLRLAGLHGRALAVQAACGVCLCWLMVDCLMFADRGIPFAQPRSPGRTSLPLMLSLFIGGLPVFCILMVRAALWLERRPLYLVPCVVIVPVGHTVAKAIRRRVQPTLEDGDEIEPEFQLLGLSAE